MNINWASHVTVKKYNKHMKKILFSLYVLFLHTTAAIAQCAMCKVNAEAATQNGNQQAMWMNNGIMILMLIPLILLLCFYLLWKRNNKE